jgi:hypothetical protein
MPLDPAYKAGLARHGPVNRFLFRSQLDEIVYLTSTIYQLTMDN